jgi:hypothetical protein
VAERIDSLTPLRGRPPVYPWETWMDGSAWRIRRGVDFLVSAESMAAQIRMRGARDDVAVFARCPDDDTVEFQFSPEEESAA